MKFPVLWLSFVSVWAGTEKVICVACPVRISPCTSVQKLQKQKQKKDQLFRSDVPKITASKQDPTKLKKLRGF